MAKKQVICDTDVMIDYWDTNQPRHNATKIILEKNIGLDNVVLSAITKMELMIGAGSKSEMQKISKQLNRYNIALINDAVTFKAIEILERYRLSHGLSLPDSFIGATALLAELELFTYNTKDFRFISGLELFKG